MKRLVTYLFVFIGTLFSLLTVLSLLGRWFWLFDVLSHFTMQYTVILLLSMLATVWLFEQRRKALVFVPALLINLIIIVPYFVPMAPPQGDVQPLRVMILNIYTENTNYSAVVEQILSQDPDLVFISEAEPPLMTVFEQQLSTQYPYVLDQSTFGTRGQAWLSKFPFTTEDVPVGGGRRARNLGVIHITWQGQPVTLAGVHPIAPLGQRWAESRNNYLNDAKIWCLQQPDNPFVLLGDFNATPWSVPMQALLSETGLQHAGRGFGLPHTWQWGNPILSAPIDYALTSSHWQTLAYEAGGNIGSDHIPLTIDIVLSR